MRLFSAHLILPLLHLSAKQKKLNPRESLGLSVGQSESISGTRGNPRDHSRSNVVTQLPANTVFAEDARAIITGLELGNATSLKSHNRGSLERVFKA